MHVPSRLVSPPSLPGPYSLVQAPLAPEEKTVNELPWAAVKMLLSCQPPSVFRASRLWLDSFGRNRTSFATKILGRLMLVFPLSSPGLNISVIACWFTVPDELSNSTLPMEWLQV